MLIIRPTASLAKKMKVKLQTSDKTSDTALGDWTSINLNIARHQLILSVSEKSRLSVVCKAAPYSLWADRFLQEAGRLFEFIGLSENIAKDELGKMNTPVFAKTNCRSTLGAINDFRYQLEYEIKLGRTAPIDYLGLSLSLSDIPTRKDGKYIHPKEKALDLLGAPPTPLTLRLVKP